MARLADIGARGRLLAGALVLALTFWGWLGGASPAFAHEFRLALVTPMSGAGDTRLSSRDVRDGFRLAVDRSPDVSHPAGAEAGDHLGGVDVDVRLVDGTEPTAATEVLRKELSAGLTVVVVIAAEPTTRAVAAVLEGSTVLLVTASGAGDSASSNVNAGALQLVQRPGPPFDAAVAREVAAAYEQVHGRELSAAAALGYDAARLVDAAIAGAGSGVEDVGAVVAAGSSVDDVLVSSYVAVPDRAAAGPALGNPAAAANSWTGWQRLVVAIGTVAILALLAGLFVRNSRRRVG